jgi:subtilisin family serine protease
MIQKNLFGLLLFTLTLNVANVRAQEADPKGWHLMDKETSQYFGISLDKAYEFLKSKNQKSTRTIVAVIDGGADTLHEDLIPILWKNNREIMGNGKDDDKNGYVDDRYGWNFLGGKDTGCVDEDSDEGYRVYHRFRTKYEGKKVNKKSLSPEEILEYDEWKRASAYVNAAVEGVDVGRMRTFYNTINNSDSILKPAIGKQVYTGHELDSFIPRNETEKKAKDALLNILKRNNAMDATNEALIGNVKFFLEDGEKKTAALSTPPLPYRQNVTKDDEYNFNARNYGNKDVMGHRSFHGTHVSGIIAATRKNGKGIDGVADNVLIMPLLVVPDGDEHDKDIALAIRYAADNGARVVNMSFGKSFSPGKKWIDDAVEYVAKKGVLLVHAAGNEGKDLDADGNNSYPNPNFLNGKKATNWITVGASGDPKIGGIAANFSNYGKKAVDVFAPGVKIYSTITGGNTYDFMQGTSMAAPVVSGIAALIRSYFPALTAEQVKSVIEQSVVIPEYKTAKPGSAEGDAMVNLADISVTGGIVNAYNAVKLAYEMSMGKVKKVPVAKPKKKK